MRVGVLGPLEVEGDGAVAPSRPKERALVAYLAMRAGRPASVADLVDALWGDEPPTTAVKSLQSYVARARASLGREALMAAGDGYRLAVDADEVDLVQFERALDAARALGAERRGPESVAVLDRALDLWRGQPLTDLPESEVARAEAVRLGELRAAALEDRVAARSASGEWAWAVAESERLVAEAPLRERRWTLLMTALFGSGRQADALRAFQRARATLVDQMGIEPGDELRSTEARIVAQDASLIAVAPEEPVAQTSARPRPHSLPSGTVTFVMTDIEGSTALWDREPTAMVEVLARHDELVATAVASAGGVLLKHKGEGDSTMSVFATAAAGVDAALRIQGMIRAEPWPAACSVNVRVAVATGEVELRDGDYFGPAVNRAARIRGAASGGQTVLGATTHALVADSLDPTLTLRSLGEHQLKGLARPEHIWELDDARARPTDPAAAEPRPEDLVVPFPELLGGDGLAGFSGREPELAAMGSAWNEAQDGRRRAVLLAGEPGIGKTRLAAEAALGAHARGAVVLYGRCDEDLAVPFQPFAEALDHLADRTSGDLQGHLGGQPGELLRLSPRLADAVPGLDPPASSDADTERYRLFEAVTSLFEAIGGEAGTVLVIDDLHWASKPTLLMLRHLLRKAPDARLLVIGTYRDTDIDRSHPLAELLADLRREAGVERIALDGLSASEVEALVVAAAGHELDDDSRSLATMVHTETSGNPLFVGEVLRHLVETGAIVRVGGRWQVAAGTTAASLPEGVRDVIGRRLNALSSEANDLATWAAVIGRDFRLDLLTEVGGRSEGEVLDVLDEVLDARLVEETGPDRYRFSHALVRASLYDELRTSRRVRMHRTVGEALERIAPDDLAALSHHFAEAAPAGEHDRAVRYTVAAAERASAQLALAEAVELHRRALDLHDDAGTDGDLARCDLLLGLARAERLVGGDQYEVTVASAAAMARSLGDGHRLAACTLVRNKGWVSSVFTVNEPFIDLLEEALALLPTDDDPVRAQVLVTLAIELAYSGDLDRVRRAADDAVAMAKRLDDPALYVEVVALALAATQGWPDAEILRSRAELLEELHARLGGVADPVRREVLQLGYVAGLAFDGSFRDREDLVPREGPPAGPLVEWSRRITQAGLALLRGDLLEVERLADEGLALGMEAAEGDALAMWGNQVLYLRRQQGRYDEALPLVQEMVDSGAPGAWAWNAALALLFTEADRLDEALPAFREAGALYRSLPLLPTELPVGAMVAAATADLDDQAVAGWLFDRLTPYADLVAGWGSISCLGPVSLSLGRLASCLGRVDDADGHLAAATDRSRFERLPYHVAEALLYRSTNLLRRDGPGDRRAAASLVDECRPIVEAHGFVTLERRLARVHP